MSYQLMVPGRAGQTGANQADTAAAARGHAYSASGGAALMRAAAAQRAAQSAASNFFHPPTLPVAHPPGDAQVPMPGPGDSVMAALRKLRLSGSRPMAQPPPRVMAVRR